MNLFYVSVRKMSSNAARGADNYEAQQLYWYCGECGGAAGDIPSLSARRFFFSLVGRASGTSFCAASGLFPGVGRCAVCAGAGGVAAGNHFVSVFYGAGISSLCGHEVRIAFGPVPAAHRRVAAPSGTGGSGGRDLSSHRLAGKKPRECP